MKYIPKDPKAPILQVVGGSEVERKEDWVPEGYMKNASGHLVPLEMVKQQDLLRDELVQDIVGTALRLNEMLREFKLQSMTDIQDLVTIAAEEYDVKMGGRKGNLSLLSFDGSMKVTRQMADIITFTEELEAAKELVNSCVSRWSEGANPNIRVIIDRAFRTDTKGQIKTSAVLELLRLEIDDEEWTRAMQALRDSIQSAGTSTYIRAYHRVGDSAEWVAIPLDFAAV